MTTKDAYFGPGVQAILEALRDADFRRRVANLGHYDFGRGQDSLRGAVPRKSGGPSLERNVARS